MQHDTITQWFTYWLDLLWMYFNYNSVESCCSWMSVRSQHSFEHIVGCSQCLVPRSFCNNTRMSCAFIKLYYIPFCVPCSVGVICRLAVSCRLYRRRATWIPTYSFIFKVINPVLLECILLRIQICFKFYKIMWKWLTNRIYVFL